MKKETTEEQIKEVIGRIEKGGFKASIDQGTERVVIGLKSDTRSLQEGAFTRYERVGNAVRILNTYKLISREFHPGNTVMDIDGIKISDGSFATMTGSCSIEGLDQIRGYARMAKAGGAKILRGGAFKPRTSPYAFQGLEEEGLRYVRQAANEFGMKVITEVMGRGHIDMVTEYSGILQIGTCNIQNFKLLSTVDKTGKPIGLERGISGTINEWLNVVEYITVEGKSPVIFIERGTRIYETATRNAFDLSAVPSVKKLTRFPIIADPSHGTGIWELVPPMARAGVTSGTDGMIVEVHLGPTNTQSDGPRSLNEKTYSRMMKEVAIMKEVVGKIQTLD